jgi:hypothetical protein
MKKTLLCSALLAALMSVSGANAAIVFQDNIGLIGSNDSSFSFSFNTANKTISTSTGSLGSGWTSGAWTPANSYVHWSGSVVNDPAKLNINPVNTGPTTYGAFGGDAGTNPFVGSINWSAQVSADTSTSYLALTAFDTPGQVYTGWASFTSSSDGSAFQLNAIAFNDFATTSNTYQSAITIGNTGNGMYVAPTYVANVAGPSAVPIPAAAWLMASGLGALGVAARKRRAKAA